MSKITAAEITALEQELERYHGSHADLYGPIETCSQFTCVEVRIGIVWLKQKLSSYPYQPGTRDDHKE